MRFFSRPARLTFPLLFSLSALLSVLLPVILLSRMACAQEGALDKSEPKGTTVEEIIKRFALKEKEFKDARDQYTFRQDVKVMTLDGDTPDGYYQQVFDVTFYDKGRKTMAGCEMQGMTRVQGLEDHRLLDDFPNAARRQREMLDAEIAGRRLRHVLCLRETLEGQPATAVAAHVERRRGKETDAHRL